MSIPAHDRGRLSIRQDGSIRPASAKVHTPASAHKQHAEAYEQWDMSAIHAYRARQTFINSIRYGEAAADLAQGAMAVAAEDDAIGTSIEA